MTFTPLDYPNIFELPRRLTDVSSWHGLVPVAFALVAMHKPRRLVELGTHKGDSYCAFCQAVASTGLETSCYAIDTWQGDEHAGHYDRSVLEELRAHHDPLYGHFSRLIPSTFDDALPLFPDGSIDLLHIDGFHTYEAVKHDFETWLPKMSVRGIVLLHDTAVRERGFGVWRFFDELKLRYPTLEFSFSHGLGIVAVGKAVEEPLRSLFDLGAEEWKKLETFFNALGHRVQLAGQMSRAARDGTASGLSNVAPEAAGTREQGHHAPPPALEKPHDRAYARWCAEKSLRLIHGQVYAERMMLRWRTRPTLHLIVRACHGDAQRLADTLDSAGTQLYGQMTVTIVADFPAPDVEGLAAAGIRWLAPGAEVFDAPPSPQDWIVHLPAGARLAPHALFALADHADAHPQWRLIYCDDDCIGRDGVRSSPRFKPDFNLDLARSMPYLGPVVAVRADAWAEAPTCDYDLALTILDRFGEDAIGHIADVLVSLPVDLAVGVHTPQTRAALARHLTRRGIAADLAEGFVPGTLRVLYRHPDTPLVSIIIPTKDKLEFLKPCVESLLAKTDYPHYEVILCDNGSSDPDVLEYYETLTAQHADRVRVLPYPHPFNFSAMCNVAAAEARGEYLLFLNNDTQIVQGEWLSRMMLHGQRPDVGVVGCRLVYPETGTLQHAGVVLGLMGVAHHPFNDGKTALTDPGYMNRAQVDQNYSAVTAACMLVRKQVYFDAGGMDEQNLAVLFNDVDLCLRVTDLGYRVVWTPFATVVHHGSTSLKGEQIDLMKLALSAERAKKEREWMFARWLPRLARDPAYNRNLALTAVDFRVEADVVPEWDPEFHDRPRVLGLPLAGGSGEYRIRGPFRALSDAGLAQCTAVSPPGLLQARVLHPVELERLAPDALVLHAAINDVQLEALELYRRFNPGVQRIMSLDDLITQLPPKNSFYRFAFKDAKPRLRRAAALCQRLIVSTEPLRELTEGMCDDVRVVPNRLERERWLGLSSQRRAGRKPRVGWAGAQQHQGDLELLYDVVRATADEVEWVFFGMCPEALRPYVHEFHDFVPSFDAYPAKLASLNLDLAVAPLEMNAFNEAKSNLRLLEYGVLGWPVVCTDIYPYRGAPVARVPNEPRAWIEAIRERVHDLDAAAREGDRLREWVLAGYLLEDHLGEWLAAFTGTAPATARPQAAVRS